GFSRQPARYPTHLASSRATKKLSRCFTIYRPSAISRKDCFSSSLQKSRLALDSKKMPSISPRWLVKSAISSALRISITLPVGPLQRGADQERRPGNGHRGSSVDSKNRHETAACFFYLCHRRAAGYVDRILRARGRSTSGAGAHEVRARSQPKDRQVAAPRHAGARAGPCRRGDRVSE